MNVSKGNLNTSYDFDSTNGVTSGGPTGIDISVSSGGVTGVVTYALDSIPTSNFTISMNGKLIPPSGGDGSQPTWSASGNAKAPFYIKSNQTNGAKEITVPAGTSVTYTAYEGDSSKNSNWTVIGAGSSQSKSNVASITFNRNFWGNIATWFTSNQSVTAPVPGVYNISASPIDDANKSDSGVMTVVGGEFKEHSSHAYGFDDYTNWSKSASDYYGAKTGKCTLPYASVRSGYQGRTQFELKPTPISENIGFESSTNR
ncbi:MAG: hypothetical protein LBM70_09150, partial [Victivallales bacterium]|nr:hypothetical protein [Victivallales bacterium]